MSNKIKKITREVDKQLINAEDCECGACSFARVIKYILKDKHELDEQDALCKNCGKPKNQHHGRRK